MQFVYTIHGVPSLSLAYSTYSYYYGPQSPDIATRFGDWLRNSWRPIDLSLPACFSVKDDGFEQFTVRLRSFFVGSFLCLIDAIVANAILHYPVIRKCDYGASLRFARVMLSAVAACSRNPHVQRMD